MSAFARSSYRVRPYIAGLIRRYRRSLLRGDIWVIGSEILNSRRYFKLAQSSQCVGRQLDGLGSIRSLS